MSLFQRKSKNRRLGRMSVLDVKLRSDQLRRNRARMAAMALGVVLGTVLGAYGLWRGGQWLMQRMVYENTAFAIRKIEASSDGVIAAEYLQRWANVRCGQNLLALDLARVKRNLEMVPLIETVAVERVLPNTLRLRVTERQPLLQVTIPRMTASGRFETFVLQLGGDGVVMPPLDPRQRAGDSAGGEDSLPTIFGIKPAELQLGREVGSPGARAALELVKQFSCSPMAGLVDLKSIEVSAADVLIVTTGQGSEITFGLENIERQLRRWRQVHDEGLRLHRGPLATLDLSVTNNAPARWLDAQMSPPPIKRSKSIPIKKRNV